MKKPFTIILFLLYVSFTQGQPFMSFREKIFVYPRDTLSIDTLSLLPGSLRIHDAHYHDIPDSIFHINHFKATLVFRKTDTPVDWPIHIQYRVFAIHFTETYFHKDPDIIETEDPLAIFPDRSSPKKQALNDWGEGLYKRGSISRGIQFGNNQDIGVNSSLNLQLTGKISEDLQMEAVISDNNIPIQPDGYTQQVQDFDNVFIRIFNPNSQVIAGDFEVVGQEGYFTRFAKKVQGGMLSHQWKTPKGLEFTHSISGSISKGKYNRMKIPGIEGNQGPYKLIGLENETYIIVLAGSEKVYIDGKLLQRGLNEDYVINYNTAELTFNPNQPITKDKRITVEFEYAEKNYTRSLIYSEHTLKTTKHQFWLNIFAETDHKNQPLFLDLTDEMKETLAAIGDDLNLAIMEVTDSSEYNPSQIRYQKTQKLVDGQLLTLYEYSTNPDSAFFIPRFSYVGEFKGNYILTQSLANGKVYQWVAPEDGIPQGNYEPVIRLATPKKHQAMSLGGTIQLSPSISNTLEVTLSQYDMNTFSPKDDEDDVGIALHYNINQDKWLRDSLQNFYWNGSVDFIHNQFVPIENFRPAEFERDWNISSLHSKHNELLTSFSLGYKNKNILSTEYGMDYLSRKEAYQGMKHRFFTQLAYRSFLINLAGNYLSSDDDKNNVTRFLRYKGSIQKAFSFFQLGLSTESEKNQWKQKQTQLLLGNSFYFHQYDMFIKNPDSLKNTFLLLYRIRNDFIPGANNFKAFSRAKEFNAQVKLHDKPTSQLNVHFTYRNLHFADTIAVNKDENNITGRLDYGFQLWKGFLKPSVFIETGSGLEYKKTYSYIEVNKGQGIYTWQDYNENNVQELDEFEVAKFSDEADYIRIFTLTQDYINVFNQKFRQVLWVQPQYLFQASSKTYQFFSNVNYNLAFSSEKKFLDKTRSKNFNPFYLPRADTGIIQLNSTLRSAVFIRLFKKLDMQYTTQMTSSKILLANGFDFRKNKRNEIKAKWRLSNHFSVINLSGMDEKEFESEFFISKNYFIKAKDTELTLQYEQALKLLASLSYQYATRENIFGGEKANEHMMGLHIQQNLNQRTLISAEGKFIQLAYNSDANTSISYEMLKGLFPGNNATWSIQLRKKLSNGLELNLQYDGRKSEQTRSIHTGGVQARAIF